MTFQIDIIRGMKWTAGAKFSGQLITWGITLAVMRLLSPVDYGLLAMATVIIAFLSMVSEAGLGPALVQAKEVTTQELRQASTFVFAVNFTIMLMLNLGAPYIADFYHEDKLVLVVRVLSLQFLLVPFVIIPEVLLQRKLEFKKRSLIELFSVIVGSFVTLVLALLQHGVWALILGNLSSVFFRAVVVNVVSPFRFIPTLSISGMRALFSFGGNVTASRFLWFFYTQADNVIVGRTLGNEALGFYSVAMHLASLPVQRVSAVLNQVSFPVFSRFQHDIVTVKLQLLKTLSLLSFIAFPILWGISSVSPELVEVVLGKKWQSAVLPLQILSLIMPFRMLVGFLPSITDAIGKPGIALRNVVLGCVVMPLSFYIGSRWGIKGVTLAWVTAYPVVFLINTQRMLAGVQLRVGEGFRAVAKSIFCASLMYLSVVLVRFMLPDGWGVFATFAILVTVGSVSYIATSLAFNVAPFTQMKRLVFAG